MHRCVQNSVSTKLCSLTETRIVLEATTNNIVKWIRTTTSQTRISAGNVRKKPVSYFYYKQLAWKSDMCRDGQTVAFYIPTATNNTILKLVQCKIALQWRVKANVKTKPSRVRISASRVPKEKVIEMLTCQARGYRGQLQTLFLPPGLCHTHT